MNALSIASVAALAILLFVPVCRIIWVLSVRREERRLGQRLSAAQLKGQRRRARVITIPLVAVFAWLFTLQLQYNLYG